MRRPGLLSSALLMGLLGGLLVISPSRAASPLTWDYPGPALSTPSFPPAAGGQESEGVAVESNGALIISVPFREIFPADTGVVAPPLFWSAAADATGRLFLGTGNTGRVLRIDRKGASVSAYDSGNLGVHAVARGLSGSVYIGTFPEGSIYRLGEEGQFEPWFDLEDRYIWAMAVDAADRLYVATGERGVIYRVMARDDGAVFFDSDEAHVTSLAIDKGGALLAGTDPGGLLSRIGPDGLGRIILDTDLREISSVAVAPDGTIYAAAISEEMVRPPRKEDGKSDLTIEVTPAADGTLLEEQAELPRKITIDLGELLPPPPGAGAGSAGRLYRIDPDGSSSIVWKSDTERIFAVTVNPEHGVLFGTGGPSGGRVYRLGQDRTISLLRQMEEPQVSALATSDDGRTYVCTSNPGRVYVIETGSLSTGRFVSSVYDAGRPSQWGTIRWDSDLPPGTRVEVFTRSGSRPSPDATWSDWSPSYPSPDGSPVGSPPGRYIQWKADLSRLKTEDSPVLRRVAVTALPRNTGPVVTAVDVLPLGARTAAPQEAAPGKEEGKAGKEVEPPARSRWVVWNSSDPDGDALTHTLSIRRAGETGYTHIAGGLDRSPYAFDDSGFEEGSYEVRLEVDDSPANGPRRALSASATSAYFFIDHEAPALKLSESSEQGPGRLVVEASASDRLGRITRGEYTFQPDGPERKWKPLPCKDGICDTSQEEFILDVRRPAASGTLTLRVFDEAGNAATAGIDFASRDGG